MYYSVDRILEEEAVLLSDANHQHTVSLALLPAGTREGDVLTVDKRGYRAAPEETARRREKAQNLLDNLLGK